MRYEGDRDGITAIEDKDHVINQNMLRMKVIRNEVYYQDHWTKSSILSTLYESLLISLWLFNILIRKNVIKVAFKISLSYNDVIK